jgi:hypothetical protein
MGAQLGNLEWAHLTEIRVESGSGSGVSLSVGALRKEPGGRAPLLGTLEEGSSTGDFERWMKVPLWMKRLPL